MSAFDGDPTIATTSALWQWGCFPHMGEYLGSNSGRRMKRLGDVLALRLVLRTWRLSENINPCLSTMRSAILIFTFQQPPPKFIFSYSEYFVINFFFYHYRYLSWVKTWNTIIISMEDLRPYRKLLGEILQSVSNQYTSWYTVRFSCV